jgi:hypothetical protein
VAETEWAGDRTPSMPPSAMWRVSNRCRILQAREQITRTFAVRAFLVAVVSGCLAERTFLPIKFVRSNRVDAFAALSAAVFATTTAYDPGVVTNAAAFCAIRNR